jgi:hypothetical protein
MKEFKVAPELAAQEFNGWVEAMDLDLDTAQMDSEDLTAFNKQKRRIELAIQRGSLVFNDEGEAVYTPSNPKSKHQEAITFYERTGASMMAMDGKKKGHDIGKTYAVMADMCKVHASVFSGLVGLDGKVCEALFALLMD